jgi:hypothetical protein
MLMSVERARMSVVASCEDPVTQALVRSISAEHLDPKSLGLSTSIVSVH